MSFNGVPTRLKNNLISQLSLPDNINNFRIDFFKRENQNIIVAGIYHNRKHPGRIAIFEKEQRSHSRWLKTFETVSSECSLNDYFGHCLCTTQSGDTVFAGCFTSDNNLGSVYVFKKTYGLWKEAQKIVAENRDAYTDFGHTFHITDDDKTLKVEAYEVSQPTKSVEIEFHYNATTMNFKS